MHGDPGEVNYRILHGHFDFLPLAGFLPLPQRGHDSKGSVVPRPDVACRNTRQQWWPARLAGHGDGAAGGEGYHVEALVVAVRAVGSEALDPGQDDTGG